MMRGASADAYAAAAAVLPGTGDLGPVGQDLFGTADLFRAEPGLRRVATDVSLRGEAKADLMARPWPLADVLPLIQLVEASDENGEVAADGQITAEGYRLTEEQAKAILDIRLQRLTALERDKLTDELREIAAKTENDTAVLGMIEGAAHAINFSHPEELAHVIRLFMADRPIVDDPDAPGNARAVELHRGTRPPG